jgi:hypothetical protein
VHDLKGAFHSFFLPFVRGIKEDRQVPSIITAAAIWVHPKIPATTHAGVVRLLPDDPLQYGWCSDQQVSNYE